MKQFLILAAALVCIVDFVSCAALMDRPPPVTAEIASAGARQHADLVTLQAGRTLFVSRCIECHTLPAVSRHTAAEWPALIDEMVGRANLNSEQRAAVLAYILTVRRQTN